MTIYCLFLDKGKTAQKYTNHKTELNFSVCLTQTAESCTGMVQPALAPLYCQLLQESISFINCQTSYTVCTIIWKIYILFDDKKTLLQQFQVIFWVVTPCSDVVGYQCFGRPCCLHLQGH